MTLRLRRWPRRLLLTLVAVGYGALAMCVTATVANLTCGTVVDERELLGCDRGQR
jgi:hypothetical protein